MELFKENKAEKVEELLLEFEREYKEHMSFKEEQLERLAHLFRELFNNAKREGI